MDGDVNSQAAVDVGTAVRERADEVAAMLGDLATLLVDEQDDAATLHRVVRVAVRTIPGCDAAGVTLVSGPGLRTGAWTDERTLAVDEAQYAVGDGPCLDALRRRRINRLDLEQAGDRWPDFVSAARAAGICSFLAAPLVVQGEALGALNLYSRSVDGFGALDEAFVGLLAAQAAAALANEVRYRSAARLAAQLEEALTSRAVIEQAKGIVMAREGIAADEAFAVLRVQSQHRNVKLRVVAQEIVDAVVGSCLPAGSADGDEPVAVPPA